MYFYVLDILDCAAICFMPYLLLENPKYFFDVGGDQYPRLIFEDYNGNFAIGKIIEDTAIFEVKVELYILSTTKYSIHKMVTMLARHYIFNVSYASKTFVGIYFIQKYLLEIGDGAKRPSKVLILYSKLVKTNTIQ